jgi:hypothetical protein
MSKLKAGDKIVMCVGSDSGGMLMVDGKPIIYYRRGDVATLTHQDQDGDWYADFNNQGNDIVQGHGMWCVGTQGASSTEDHMFDLVKSN